MTSGMEYSGGSKAEIVSRVYKVDIVNPESLDTDMLIDDILLADTALYDYIEFSGRPCDCVWVGRICRNMINVMRPEIRPVFAVRFPYVTKKDKADVEAVPRYDLWPWDYIIIDDGSGTDQIHKVSVYAGIFVDHVMTDKVDKIGE